MKILFSVVAELWVAIRISCSIPLVFTPYKYKDNLYVDGALNNPCPSNYFKNQEKTVSFILESDISENDNVESNDFQSYLTNLIFYCPIWYFYYIHFRFHL